MQVMQGFDEATRIRVAFIFSCPFSVDDGRHE
jgi:hypothetical protein